MNIVFVYHDATKLSTTSCAWRGEMLYNAIKKTGLHNVDYVNSTDFVPNNHKNNAVLQASQIIIIEGSPEIDLLTMINFWKSKGKKVVVDIPVSHEEICSSICSRSESAFSITQMYSKYHNSDLGKVDKSERFRWGMHLADSILVSSDQQQSRWQISAPVRIIPEYIDFESIEGVSKSKHEQLTIGLFSNQSDHDQSLKSIIEHAISLNSRIKWLPLSENNYLLDSFSATKTNNIPAELLTNYSGLFSQIDLAIIFDDRPVKGEFYRIILELMALRIPFILNDQKGYQEVSKYGLIINNRPAWLSNFSDMIKKPVDEIKGSEEGYLFSIGHNVDDHIHEILAIFSDILKIPT